MLASKGMMRIIPFFAALVTVLLAACSRVTEIQTAQGLPCTRTPFREIPEARAWHGRTPLVVGMDSACALPVAVFPHYAKRCKQRGPVRDGFDTAPIGVSLEKGREPLVAYSHLVARCGAPVHALVGWPVLQHFVWHLELAEKRHGFHTSVPAEVHGPEWKKLVLNESDVARVELPGCGECILDTGATFGLYLSREEWRKFLRLHPELKVGIYAAASPAAGGTFTGHYVVVPHIKLGPWHLYDIHVCESFSPLTGPRMLGREALAQFDIWMDGPARRLHYRPLPR